MQMQNSGIIRARWRRFGFLCLALYGLVLLDVTLFTYNYYVYGRSVNLSLFDSIELMFNSGDPWLILKNILGNVLLFLPFGVLLPLLLRRFRNGFVLFAAASVASLGIESAQYGFAKRIFDIDDVFLNVIGAMCGWLVAMLVFKIIKKARG